MRAGIELGGTKTVVAIGNERGDVLEEIRYPTSDPATTLNRACEWIAARGDPKSIGIAAFGPIVLQKNHEQYGRLLATPKENWQGASICEPISRTFPKAKLALDTDVNAAALAEARVGAGAGVNDLVYITIGTGIGAGILTEGRLLHGTLHAEFGHLKVPREPSDAFAGICPFHGDCLEGMASGPAIAARWNESADRLPATHPAWELQAWYLAHGVLSLVAIVAPACVVIGGGVAQVEGLHQKIQTQLCRLSAGYFPLVEDKNFIRAPMLGQQAGIIGALILCDL